MKDKLTAKQRILVEGVSCGLTHYEAYAKAFSTKGKTKHGIESSVSEILKKPECLAYRAELEAKAESEAVAGRMEILKYHTSVIRTPIGEAMHLDSSLCQSYKNGEKGESYTMPSKLASCQEICKMQGYYASDKVEVTGANGQDLIPALDVNSPDVIKAITEKMAVARAAIDAARSE